MSSSALDPAIVTGGSRGIGEQVARLLAAAGHPVVVGYAVNQERARNVVNEIVRDGGRAIAFQCNTSESDDVRAIFEAAQDEYGAPNVLANCAGVPPPKHMPLEQISDETFDHLFDVNARGTFYMLREASRRFTPGGRIVTVSSSVMPLAVAGLSCYAGSKVAVEAFTQVLAKELRGREITVNCVAPGPTATEHFFGGKSDEAISEWEKMPPLERLGRPIEIASVIAFLISEPAAWVNGQVIRVNGGLV
jgi:3-oxoacyl-[acyl-carrier protein] reductase